MLIKGENLLAGHSLSNDRYVQKAVQVTQSNPIFFVLMQKGKKTSHQANNRAFDMTLKCLLC